MAGKAKEVAIEEASRIRTLTSDAARSGAYLYPLRGIFYLISHRSLWCLSSISMHQKSDADCEEPGGL